MQEERGSGSSLPRFLTPDPFNVESTDRIRKSFTLP